MKTFYVSLMQDLIGCYLAVEAEDKRTVERYLQLEYRDRKTHTWKLPWCSVYEQAPGTYMGQEPLIIARRGRPLERELVDEDYEFVFGKAVQS